jgi:hypothetical protein
MVNKSLGTKTWFLLIINQSISSFQVVHQDVLHLNELCQPSPYGGITPLGAHSP